jgi:hypothetical protein
VLPRLDLEGNHRLREETRHEVPEATDTDQQIWDQEASALAVSQPQLDEAVVVAAAGTAGPYRG